MDLIQDWLLPLATLGGIIVAIVLYINKSDTRSEVNEAVLDQKFKMNNAILDEKFKNVNTKLDVMMTNHLAHMDIKIDKLCSKVNEIDKNLFAHLNEHQSNK